MLVGLYSDGIAQFRLTVNNSPLTLTEQDKLVTYSILGLESYVELQVTRVQRDDYKFLYQASQENVGGLKEQLALHKKIDELTEQSWWDTWAVGALTVIIGELIIATIIILLQ